MDIAKLIDNSLLKPNISRSEVERFVIKSARAGFYAVCLNPVWIRTAKSLVGDKIKVCSVVGFPLGESKKEVKLHEAEGVLEEGADEIDAVMSISAFKSGMYGYVAEELLALRRVSEGRVMKVIVETAYLSKAEKLKALEICINCGADFIKTSTGFAPKGAEIEDVRMFKRLSGGKIKVKAAGGIRDLKSAIEFVKAGADRIGTSSGFSMLNRPP